MTVDPQEFNQDDFKIELDQELGELSPDEMERLAQAQPRSTAPDERGRVNGIVIQIRNDDVIIDLGGKSEAFVPLSEFDPAQPPEPGQSHSFVMQGIDQDSGMMRLSLREARLDADIQSLKIGDVLELRVTGVNVGGLELKSERIRAFMPKSQVELHRVDDFSQFIGRKLECEISEIDRKGRNLVVSRRKILERQREEEREAARSTLTEGEVRTGAVKRITDFGAFVDIGGIEGLLRVGDMSYARVGHPKDVVKVGEQIQVKVLKIDHKKDRIALGMKQLAPDPWEVVDANYRAGATVEGRVTKLMNFGAFVELEPGVEGLIPVSEMSWTQRVHHPKDVLSEGDNVRVSVLTVDAGKRKLSLSLKALAEDPWEGVDQRYPPNAMVKGAVKRLADFGAFVQLEEGIEGLVHVSEMSDKRIRTPGDIVKEGDVIDVRVKSVDLGQRRIALSMKKEDTSSEASADDIAAFQAATARAAKPRKKKLRGGLD